MASRCATSSTAAAITSFAGAGLAVAAGVRSDTMRVGAARLVERRAVAGEGAGEVVGEVLLGGMNLAAGSRTGVGSPRRRSLATRELGVARGLGMMSSLSTAVGNHQRGIKHQWL